MNKLLNSPKKGAIDAIVVDLPYYGVVKDEFDNQWLTEQEYLKWVEDIFTVASKLTKDNGNIIVFCSRQYARHICNIFDDKMNWT